MNLRCLPTLSVVEVKAIEVDLGEAMKDSKRGVIGEEHGRLFSYFSFGHFGRFLQGAPFFH